MPDNNTTVAKISGPKIAGAFQRERLFHLLDECTHKPIIWLCAPAGAGKTILAASYIESRNLPCLWYQVDEGDGDLATFFYYMGLAARKAAPRYKNPLPLLSPEYLQGIPTFTRRYFEELYKRLVSQIPAKPPFPKGEPVISTPLPKGRERAFVIVLDNYQDAPGTAFHEMISVALEVIPDGIQVIALSRSDTPPQLARLLANNRISFVGWGDIRFTLEESGNLIEKISQKKLPKEMLEHLYMKTEGWAAGLVLMKESVVRNGVLPDIHAGLEQIFNYFAGEIFDRADKTTQDILLKTAFLNKIEPVMAEKLTGIHSTGQILERLCQSHYFTQKQRQVYQYHPLFREFLLDRARRAYSPAELSAIQRSAASLLTESKQFEDAAHLFREAGEWKELAGLTLSHAQMLVTQGRSRVLEEWVSSIPEEICKNAPWLLYWLGISRLAASPSESRGAFERAFEIFEKSDDHAGFFLSWCGVVDSYLYEWNNFSALAFWIDRLQGHLNNGMKFPSREIEAAVVSTMTGALFIGSPGRPETVAWAERAYESFRLNANPVNGLQALVYTFNYFVWAGSISCARNVVNEMEMLDSRNVPPLIRITFRQAKSLFLNWSEGASECSRKLVDEALEFGKHDGLYAWDNLLLAQGVYACLNEGNTGLAGGYLDRMKKAPGSERGLGFCLVHILDAWLNFLLGKTQVALVCSEKALSSAERVGVPFVEMLCRIQHARLLFSTGEREKAIEQAAQLVEEIKHCRSRSLEFMLALTRAIFFLDTGDENRGVEQIRHGLSVGRKEGYGNMVFWWCPQDMARLCSTALERGIEPDYVIDLIKKRRLTPSRAYPYLNNWPYPVKIYTRGRFSIMLDGKPYVFSGKMQKKPVEMLKVLIKSGGRGVAEEEISDALWPDAEGDMAHQSFKFTLHKLRKLLGNDMVIRVEGGQVTLDRRYCWVDAWAEK